MNYISSIAGIAVITAESDLEETDIFFESNFFDHFKHPLPTCVDVVVVVVVVDLSMRRRVERHSILTEPTLLKRLNIYLRTSSAL